MNLDELEALVINAVEDLKAFDIKLVNVQGRSSVTDVLLFASGRSDRQVKSIANNIIIEAKKVGIQPLGVEGLSTGDWVLVDGVVEGTVENIGFRSTVVRRFDKAPVFVPNDVLSNSAVTNFSEMTHRRIYWKIGIEYRTTIDQLREIRDGIETWVLENEEFASPEEVATFVRIDSFNDSSIDIMLYCFTVTTDWGTCLRIKEDLAYAIKSIVEGAGSGFAFPSQSLYVESLPGQAAEVFVPPTSETKG